ncbi:MAG: PilZ domain-containing protein [Rhodospirillales bacterium]|nr:PilZ domain-containing protein [Rhodospirillales bacterium]
MSADLVDSADRRIHSRYSVMWSGELRARSDFDWYVLDCRIRNFSISGVRSWSTGRSNPGGSVVLGLRMSATFAGEVAWSKSNRLGICFDEASDRLAELIREEPAQTR